MNMAIDPAEVRAFRERVCDRFGLLFDEARLEPLADALARRCAAKGLAPADYMARMDAGAMDSEDGALAQELTVTETYFFRNIAQFHALRDSVLPDRLSARASSRSLFFLSAGCASGDEAYSIAMVARDAIPDPGWTVHIQAADINPAILRRAKAGRYSPWALRETPPEVQDRWFRADGPDMVLDERIRSAVDFQERNLAADMPAPLPPDGYDAIFCRNMLMYFSPDAARALVARLASWLAPGGYLFLGHAETLRGLSQDFHLRHSHDSFYYQRRDGAPHPAPIASPTRQRAGRDMAPLPAGDAWIAAIGRSAERIEALTHSAEPARGAALAAPPGHLAPVGEALDLLARERFGDALRLLEPFPAGQAADPDLLLLHATLLSHDGQAGRAERVARMLLERDEFHAGGHYVLALCREAAGDSAGAADHYQLAAYLDGAFAMPRLRLGLLHRRLGRREDARTALAAALPLIEREDSSRLLFFGGGFSRDALLGLCRAELAALGERP